MKLLRTAAFAVVVLASMVARAGQWEFPIDWFLHNTNEQRVLHEALLGKPMPVLDLSDWKNGELKPADLKGKIVVIDFWATWCPPCIASIPHNNKLQAKYRLKGVEIIGVCTSNTGQDQFDQVVADKKIEYPVARDKDLKSENAWVVMWYPTYAVVDRKGIVRAIGLHPDYVSRVIEKLLAEPAPEK